jgi:double-stranded uracil-DNA glycosylase
MESRVGFPPVARAEARVLILGSLPGAESLRVRQYYANPQNRFWRIMGEIVGARAELTYDARLERLVQRKIALWDVCASAERVGSLDSSILVASVVPNDFRVFLHAHGDIRLICFNGGGAERLFRRLVLPRLAASQARIPRVRLPSTSPAHAGMKGDEKLRLWRDALGHLMSEG